MPSEENRARSNRGYDRETDRKYVKFKMKRIKEARNRGNTGEANRHAQELLQYLGLDGRSELPIERILLIAEAQLTEMTRMARFHELRNAVDTEWW